MSLNKSISLEESRNLTLLCLLFLIVPLTWVVFFGWHPAELIPQEDHLRLGHMYMRELSRAFGDWHELLYWPGLGGGVKVHDVTGSLPFAQLLAYMGSPPLIIANLQVMFIQILFAYLCTCCVVGVSREIYGHRMATPWFILLLVALTFAFLPILGWRMTHGHEPIIIGLFVLLCFMVLFLGEMSRNRSVTNLAVCLVTLCHVFQFNGFQLAHYSVLLGAPMILGLTFAQPGVAMADRLKWYGLPILVFVAALLISFPKFYGVLLNGLGDDSSRTSGFEVIYSYTVAEVMDWLTSLPWSTDFIPEARQDFLHHEVNYPLGPIALLVLLAAPGTPLIRFASGIAVSLALALIISMNLAPLSTWIVSIVPLLESFRVPARAMLPFVVILSILGMATLLKRSSAPEPSTEDNWQYLLLAALALGIAGFNLPMLNDLLLVVVIAGVYVFRHKMPQPAYVIVFALFAGGAISAFKQRAHEPLVDPVSDAAIAAIRQDVYEHAPALQFPLNRAQINVMHESLGPNTGFFMDVSTLTSYWFPLARYTQLVVALEGQAYMPTQSAFFHSPQALGFDALNRLYNVGWVINPAPEGLSVSKADETFGAAWLSDNIVWHEGWAEMAQAVKDLKYHRRLLLKSDDDKTDDIEHADSTCKIESEAVAIPSEFPYQFELGVEGRCFLTISMNYTGILSAEDQDGRTLQTFPAYGALLGVVVSSDTERVSVMPKVTTFPGIGFVQLLGFALALGILLFVALRDQAQRISR